MQISQIDDYIRKIATTSDGLGMDEECPCQKEFDILKKEADKVVPRIEYHLRSFAFDGGSSVACPTWYYGARHLIRLLASINTDESLNVIADTLKMKSNIAEWYWKIQSQSAIELGNTGDKRWLGVLNECLNNSMAPVNEINTAIEKISGESSKNPIAILNNAERSKSGMELIEYLYDLKDQVNNWNSEERGYYYYLLGLNSEKVDYLKETDIPKSFYAAQVYANPINTSLGWMKFDKKPGKDNAKLLHDKYPIPSTIDEIKVLKDASVIEETKEDISQQEAGRVNPFADNKNDKISSDSQKNTAVDNIKSDVDNEKLSDKDKIKLDYLKSINKSLDTHMSDYDSKLVEVSDEGNITDYNHIIEILKKIGLYYGVIVLLILVIGAIISFTSGLIPTMIICICVLFIIVGVFLLFDGFYNCVKSSRDTQYKLISSLYILPLLLLFAYSVLMYGLVETLMIIGLILIVGVLGFIALAVCGVLN